MLPGQQFHIYNRGNNREIIFIEKENYYYFLEKFNKYLAPYVIVHVWCLMKTHFHFLIEIKNYPGAEIIEYSLACRKKLTAVEKAFKNFFICYAKSINKKYHRTGALFQHRFRKKAINQSNYYTALVLYIHSNPIEAGYCKNFCEWEFSSYNEICNESTVEGNVVGWFGNKKMFMHAHDEYLHLKNSGEPDQSKN